MIQLFRGGAVSLGISGRQSSSKSQTKLSTAADFNIVRMGTDAQHAEPGSHALPKH